MSSIQLSEELIVDIQKTLHEHDPKTQDMGIAIQYLAAIIGLLLANFKNLDNQAKQQLLGQLFEFTMHVMTDNDEKQPEPKQDNAFGIWKPEDNN